MNIDDTNPITSFDRARFKKALSWVESSGGKALTNKTSSAAGKYHFLYSYIKGIPELKGYTKMDFVNDDAMQEKVMDMALDGKLQGFPNYIKYSGKLKKEYGSELEHEEIAALTHFLGMGGVRKYLKNKSYKVPGVNATVDQYLTRFRNSFGERAKPIERPAKPVIEQQKDNIPTQREPQQKQAPIRPEEQSVQMPVQEQRANPQPQTRFIETSYQAAPQAESTDVISFLQNYPNAYGGQVTGQDTGQELQRFDEGGTHEQNPYGGIPIGVNQNGEMNTVEEGETKINLDDGEYVFSNRIGMQSAYNKK